MKLAAYFIAMTLVVTQATGENVGFQQVTIPDPAGKPLAVGIWYPASAPVSNVPLGMFTQSVAVDGVDVGNHLPLILISQGTGGSPPTPYDTPLPVANA